MNPMVFVGKEVASAPVSFIATLLGLSITSVSIFKPSAVAGIAARATIAGGGASTISTSVIAGLVASIGIVITCTSLLIMLRDKKKKKKRRKK